ncbi:hypothetical protein HDU77_005855 [Chytriomyces hyalinus]|nr:hypothetical protein HDU77_005855 [Chytriomyces hyalinus]
MSDSSRNRTASAATNGTVSTALDVNDHPVHIANLCIIVPALLLNLSLISSILRNNAVLLKGDIAGSKMETAVLNKTIFALLVSSLYNGLVILSSSALTLADGITPLIGGPDGCNANLELPAKEIMSRFTLVVFGYLGIFVFFCTSVVLALERHWVIRFGRSLSTHVIGIVYGIGLVFYCVIMAAFTVAHINSTYNGGFIFKYARPFAMPGSPSLLVKTLFLTGLAFFPVSIVFILAVYARSYLLVAKVVDENVLVSTSESESEEERRWLGIRAKRGVLLRCTLMSVGCLIFYAAIIGFMFAFKLNQGSGRRSGSRRASNASCKEAVNSSWDVVLSVLLPTLDILWTPALILWVQGMHRTYFLRDLKHLVQSLRLSHMQPSTTSTVAAVTANPCPPDKEKDVGISSESSVTECVPHSAASCALSSSMLVATLRDSGVVLAASERAKSLSMDKLFEAGSPNLRAVAPATLELITPSHAQDMRLLVCRHALSEQESALYSLPSKEPVDLWLFENISHLARLESRLSDTYKHLHSVSLNNFWTSLVAQDPPMTPSNTAQTHNVKRRARTHSEPPFPSRYHDSNSFSSSSSLQSGSKSLLVQADMLLVSAEKTIVNAAGRTRYNVLATVTETYSILHYTAPISAQSFSSLSNTAVPPNLSSSKKNDTETHLPPLNAPPTLFIRLNEFGRINQAYPITQFLGQNSQLVMNRFIMRFVYSHDLARLCTSLSNAMREGMSEVYVRWDWRLFNESVTDASDGVDEYGELEDNGETGDEDHDLLDNPFDDGSDDEVFCQATADLGTNNGADKSSAKAFDNEITGDLTAVAEPLNCDESIPLDKVDQGKQQKHHAFEHKHQLSNTSRLINLSSNECVGTNQQTNQTTSFFNDTLSITLDDDPALSAYQSTQPTRRPSFVEPRMPTLAESGASSKILRGLFKKSSLI